VLDSTAFVADGSASRIALELDWYRRLLVDGKAAYEIGNVCDTCPFYFERLPRETDPESTAVAVIDALRSGAKELSPSLLDAISPVIPRGEYRACLLDLRPELVWPGGDRDYFSEEHVELFGFDSWWGLPHYPRTPYYRAGDVALSDAQRLFEFVVPLVPRASSTRWSSRSTCVATLAALLSRSAFSTSKRLPRGKMLTEDCRIHPSRGTRRGCIATRASCITCSTVITRPTQPPAPGGSLDLVSLVALEAGVSTTEDLDRALTALDASAGVEE
jgi:hypothetical protein